MQPEDGLSRGIYKQQLVYENTVIQLMYFYGAGLVHRTLGPNYLGFPKEKQQ